jgi:alpha-glucosidase
LIVKGATNKDKILWQSIPNKGFLSSADGSFSTIEYDGFFGLIDQPNQRTNIQTIDSISYVNGAYLLIRGQLKYSGTLSSPSFYNSYFYSVNFTNPIQNNLAFDVNVIPVPVVPTSNDVKTSNIRIYLNFASIDKNEMYFGFGEQSVMDNSGRCVPILTSEGGVGRGLEPISWLINAFRKGIGGSPQTTYTAVPHYMTSNMRSLFLENTELTIFNFMKTKSSGEIEIELITSSTLDSAKSLKGRILQGDTPTDLVAAYTLYSGRQKPLPDWVTTGGAIVGMCV